MVPNRTPLTARRSGTLGTTRPWWRVAVDSCAVLGFFALLLAQILDWAVAVDRAEALTALIIALPLGVALADLATGVIHWMGDTFFREDTAIVGSAWIRPFREHHRDPLAITRHGPLEVTGNSCILLLGFLAAVRLWGPIPQDPTGALLWPTLLVLCFAIAVSNPLHRWAHAATPPAPVRCMQRWRLVLSPDAHARHHEGRHDRAFCVTTGWCNAALDRSRVLPWLERRFARGRDTEPDAHMSGS